MERRSLCRQFGDRTGEGYFYQTVAGTFSNSATNNSKLYATTRITDGRFEIDLVEYSSNRPDTTFIEDGIFVKMKNEKNETMDFYRLLRGSSTNTVRTNGLGEYTEVIDFFKKSENVKIYVAHRGSTYNFKINTKIIK